MTAKICVNIKETPEKFDFYIADFENLETIDNRMIGGIDMTGRTYENVGMEWTEYIGVINDTQAISVRITRVDMADGDAVLDSIAFA